MSKLKRRWLRFDTRTLLFAVTIFCVWLGWRASIVRERTELRRWAESHGRINLDRGSHFMVMKIPGRGTIYHARMRLFPKRRWLTFSVRTLLVAVTIFCVWLGWQVSIVRERQSLRESMSARSYGIAEAPLPPYSAAVPPKAILPWHRRMMGDNGVLMVVVCDETTDSELEQVRRVFPEATVVRGGPVPEGE